MTTTELAAVEDTTTDDERDDFGEALANAAEFPADIHYTPGEALVSQKIGMSDLEEEANQYFEEHPGRLQSLVSAGKLRIARATCYGRTVLIGHPRALGAGLIVLGVAGLGGVKLLRRQGSHESSRKKPSSD